MEQVRSRQWRNKSQYKLDLVGVQEVRWDGGGTEPAGEYTFFYGRGNENHELVTGFFIHKRIISFLTTDSEVRVRFPALPDVF
jgi:hypothetical protein